MARPTNHENDDFGLFAQLSPTEAELVAEMTIGLQRKRGWADYVSLPYLLSNWPRIVDNVEGYDGVIEEYWNDLDTRNILEDVIDELPHEVASRVAALLRPWDEKFRTRTVDSPGLWRRSNGKPGWWNERFPVEPGPMLQT
jgi:hypothetical protein